MITVTAALDAIVRHSKRIDTETVPLARALDRVVAQKIISAVDSPPFDKSLMDGYAVRSAETAASGATLKVVETVMAGQVPARSVEAGQAIRIMTGAPMPVGADAVVPVEKSMAAPQYDDVHLSIAVKPGANVLHRGESMKAGDDVFTAAHRLRPQDLGVLAELGIANVSVRRRPRVAVLATGDELVPPDATPGPGQIRNSNETLLAALVSAAGGEPVPLGIARDRPEELRAKVDAGLDCDMLLLSGGVSAGLLDLVPSVLQEAGVEQVFHKVNVKPGKPVYFGVRSGECGLKGGIIPQSQIPDPKSLVFGLPGNPVSTLVCFELFAKTALRVMLGTSPPEPRSIAATLPAAYENHGDRPTYHPALISISEDGRVEATPVRWSGSGDLRATAAANGVVVFEPHSTNQPGETIAALIWSGSRIDD
jgi:molybdopterin molybdotransferase